MERRSRVAVVSCTSYDEEKVYKALKLGLSMLGGLGQFAAPEQKILVKPNFLKPGDESKAIATHPSVIKGFLRILQEEGYKDVSYGDSPAASSGSHVAKGLGLESVEKAGSLDIYGASFAEMTEERMVSFPEGQTAKEFPFCREVAEADVIFNLCKMKTHALERITGAVKNVYGFICGPRKAQGHVMYPNASRFARYLGDIHRCKGPKLNIMDGIVAMEGNGPGAGDPAEMDVLLFSSDPVALDTVFCWLVDLDPKLVPTNLQCAGMGVGTFKEEEIEVFLDGEAVTRERLVKLLGNPGFNVERGAGSRTLFTMSLALLSRFRSRPHIDASKCISCGLCAEHCPVDGGALSFENGRSKPPVYDYKKCIGCFCCQEICPRNAIYVGRKPSSKRKD